VKTDSTLKDKFKEPSKNEKPATHSENSHHIDYTHDPSLKPRPTVVNLTSFDASKSGEKLNLFKRCKSAVESNRAYYL
jgi:hypothetical protein